MGEPKEKEAEAAPKSGGMGKMIMLMGITSLISVGAALGLFYVVMAPKLAPPAEHGEGEEGVEEEVAEEGGGGGHGGGGETGPVSLSVQFEDGFATVVMPSPDMPASQLMYKITLDCSNSQAKSQVESNMPRFTAKIREIHSYRKRAELDNPQLEADILKQVVQECNAILQELLGKPSEKTRIVTAYHEKFFVQDL